MFNNCTILLGVTGSIAAYKAVELARRLIDEGASVKVIMTDAACRFITPYVFEAVTGNPVHTDLFDDSFSHIRLPQEASLFLIAPATANTINKLSCGIADNLLTSAWLAYEGPSILAPAMNFRMYRNRTVQSSIEKLSAAGTVFAGPASGDLACGEQGKGRMVEVPEIVDAVIWALIEKDLTGEKIIVTAGPTVEPLDPVRFISNRSSGLQGYAIAQAAARRGAAVTLISGPSALNPPRGVAFRSVETAAEMEREVMKEIKRATALIMAAAVSDYSPADVQGSKEAKQKTLSLKLKQNNDILKAAAQKKGNKIMIGFAAESGKDIQRASEKLHKKNLDLIILNDIGEKGAGFNVDTNIVTLIDRNGSVTEYPLMKKTDTAHLILNKLAEMRGTVS